MKNMRDWPRQASEWLQVFLSRLINVSTGGDWELFCTRVVRNKWHRTAAVLDAIHYAWTGERQHTRGAYLWDRRKNGRPK